MTLPKMVKEGCRGNENWLGLERTRKRDVQGQKGRIAGTNKRAGDDVERLEFVKCHVKWHGSLGRGLG